MAGYSRKLICLYPDNELSHDEYILKKCINGTVAELLRLTFREDDKHLSMAGYDPQESRVTNWNFAGLYSAYQASDENHGDELATAYPGVFDFTEYFSRSVDASKGDFYEMRIAASDPNEVLDVDRNIENLPQYLYAPHSAWKRHEYTPRGLDSAEETRYEQLNQLKIDFSNAPNGAIVDQDANARQADSVLLLDHSNYNTEDDRVLVFGEQRSSVNTGGTTARGSLYDKPKAVLKGIASNLNSVKIPSAAIRNTDIEVGEKTLFEFLREDKGITRVNFFIGMLFNTIRQPAERQDDRDDGRWSESDNQTKEIYRLCQRLNHVSVNHFDNEKLDLEVEIEDPSGKTDHSLTFRLAHEYGNHYVNALYNGFPDREFDELEGFPPQGEFNLPTVMGETDADDLWLHFSIAERENKAYYHDSEGSEDGENNAMRLVDLILNRDELREQLALFRGAVESGERERIRSVFKETRNKFADAYIEEYVDKIQDVYMGEPESYAHDLAGHVLEYDVVVAPLFLQLFPDYHEYESEEEMPREAFIRKSVEEYLYEPKSEYDGADRVAMFKAIRRSTRYERGGVYPEDPNDTIDWTSALTAGEVADKIGTDSARPHYMDQDRRGLVQKQNSKYAVPADIADLLDEFLFVDNSEQEPHTSQTTL